MTTLARRRHWATLAAGLVLLAGCADPDDGGSSDGGSKADAKSIAFFGFAKANSFSVATFEGVQEQAAKEGAKAEFLDSNFDAQARSASSRTPSPPSGTGCSSSRPTTGPPSFPPCARPSATASRSWSSSPRRDPLRHRRPAGPRDGVAGGRAHPQRRAARQARRRRLREGQGRPVRGRLLRGPEDAAARQRAHRRGREDAEGRVRGEGRRADRGRLHKDSGRKAMQDLLQAHPGVDVVIGSSQACSAPRRSRRARTSSTSATAPPGRRSPPSARAAGTASRTCP